MQGHLHPSLRTYVDCFLSPPFPKSFPRGGGVHDQDPILMRDFRFIREFEVKWKSAQAELSKATGQSSGGGFDLEQQLDKFIEEKGLEDEF